jgi:hypothetical protein
MILPNRETLTVFDPNGLSLGVVTDAKRLMSDDEERAPADGKYVVTHIDFRLPVATLSATVLPACTIIDAAQMAYRVLAVDPPGTYNGTWNCYCAMLRVFRDTVTIKFPTNLTDTFASPITDQSATILAQPAAIQEISAELVEFQHKKGFRKRYSIWILTDPTLPLGSLLIDQNGIVYVVESVENRNRIDELTRITCIVNP